MMLLALVFIPMPVVTIIEKEVFIAAIRRKGYCRYSEAWESAFETIESCERTRVSPLLSADRPISYIQRDLMLANCLHSRPRIF